MTTRSTRVRFLYTSDPYTRLVSGTLGTIVGEYVDPWGDKTYHINWDDGSNLSMIPSSGDRFERITESENN